MSTIAEKLTLLASCKDEIRIALTTKGQPVTESTPLSEYATKITDIPVKGALVPGEMEYVTYDFILINLPIPTELQMCNFDNDDLLFKITSNFEVISLERGGE